ncbi:MAG TPA: mechanosensitive ion channel domain-containing protein [Terriglobia bacterium]|nr:mechanosensitive ion channel domain-containing protein [Terriglobia bacterium]
MTVLIHLQSALQYALFSIGGEPITTYDLLAFFLTLFLTAIVARRVRRLLEIYFLRRLPVEAGAQYAVASLTQYGLWVVGLLVGLKVLNINLTAIAVVAGALGVGIGFGLQNVVANFVSGLVLLVERPIRVRDRVTMEGVEGNVREINFRSTTIQTNDNISIIVPNSEFINGKVINWSLGDPKVRIHVPVGVAYGSDLPTVTRTLLAVAAETPGVLKMPQSEVRFLEFGDSSLNFDLLVWTNDPANHLQLRSRLNFAIDAAFRRAGVEIPFPQRDVHVKSAKGLLGIFNPPKRS